MADKAAADAANPAEEEDKGTISREDVKKHNTQKDCWVVIHGAVYDVTKYLDEHPGGPEIIQDVSGEDASDEFEDTGHSPEARETLAKYKIGDVKGGALKSSGGSKSGGGSSEGPSVFFMLIVLVAMGGMAYFMYEAADEEASAKEL